MSPRSEEEIDRLARKRAGAKLGWYIHLTAYVVVNLGLYLISTQFGEHRWNLFPALGWGLGLIFHGLSVWVLGAGSGLRERMVERERERLMRQRKEP